MRALVAILLLLLVNAVVLVSAATGEQRAVEEPGVSGYVLAPDWTAVSGGTVIAQSGFFSTTASIDNTGRFRLVTTRSGSQQLIEPPGLPHTIALIPVPPVPNVRPRVITTSGEPLPNAVVELISANPTAVPRVAATDTKGIVAFPAVPPGSLQLIAHADGFVTSTMRVAEGLTSEIVFSLTRGYRAIASVDWPAAAGPQVVRVLNDGNASMDDFLDGQSDRRFEPPGRLSLGPLAPGAYVIELHGAGGRRTERIRVVDRDVYATFR